MFYRVNCMAATAASLFNIHVTALHAHLLCTIQYPKSNLETKSIIYVWCNTRRQNIFTSVPRVYASPQCGTFAAAFIILCVFWVCLAAQSHGYVSLSIWKHILMRHTICRFHYNSQNSNSGNISVKRPDLFRQSSFDVVAGTHFCCNRAYCLSVRLYVIGLTCAAWHGLIVDTPSIESWHLKICFQMCVLSPDISVRRRS